MNEEGNVLLEGSKFNSSESLTLSMVILVIVHCLIKMKLVETYADHLSQSKCWVRALF